MGLCRLQAQEDEGAAGEDPEDRGWAPSLMDIPAAPQGEAKPRRAAWCQGRAAALGCLAPPASEHLPSDER